MLRQLEAPSSFATLGKRRFCVSRLLQRGALGGHASMLEMLPGLALPQLKALGVLAHPSQLWSKKSSCHHGGNCATRPGPEDPSLDPVPASQLDWVGFIYFEPISGHFEIR
ncbi:hypothetical protein PIB30_076616 [Stylosanthes scabra]|uniref:Uncharacterized protein n=1 Tax=Stylosanthes scabra TaxID=79078 RepID=A0ABU6UT07_9FABA|nr:hypothetical protein [Stylosanthes scabra]